MESDEFNYERIAEAITYIAEHVHEQPTLDQIADQVHISPHHFQRIFTAWAGVSPKRFLQFLTANYLKGKIKETSNLIEAAQIGGLSSQSRVHDLFTTVDAVTPQEYKSEGKGVTITYGFHQTPFGDCFIGVTERGICGLAFLEKDSQEMELNNFKLKWPSALIVRNEEITSKFVHQIFDHQGLHSPKIHLFLKGTNFQIKVWEALLKIPSGALTTYQLIAEAIGNPKAVRAVGTAVGENPIAFLIPCHRVIRKEGKLGEYRWGSTRKKALIGWEAARDQ
jgi:AraC family transcriptional regulator of adaptative response/methylated-DNA-[protein]-cysteine methyltransferase